MKMKMKMKKKAELPNDLIIGVLCKLRLKDIARFQCVSKAWERMIRDCCFPIVCKKKQPVEMLLFNDSFGIKAVSRYPSNLVFAPETVDSSKLIDCCNGLLLLRCDYRDRYASVVYNPINKEFVHIPEPNPPSKTLTIYAVLAFDPCVSRHYKVVQYSFIDQFCCVFSSETWTWSRLELAKEFLRDWGLSGPKSFYWDGALYRLSFRSQLLRISLDADIHKRNHSHAFRLPSEEGMELPFREVKGCIGMMTTKDNNIHVGLCDAGNSNVRIWELRIAGKQYDWVMKSTISLQTIAKRNALNLCAILLWAFDPVLGKVFMSGLVLPKAKNRKRRVVSDQKLLRKVLVYDLNNHELELYSTYEKDSPYAYFPFAPCLVHLEKEG